MPRGGSRPGERRGGRQKGTPNRKTIEQKLLFAAGEGRRANGVPLAKEVLEASMLEYIRLANTAAPPERGQWLAAKQKLFHFYRDKANECARWLAPYQSPQYRSITVQPPREIGAPRGTPGIDALEDFMLRLARARRLNPPKTIEAVPVPDETPAEAVKVVDGKNGNGSA